MRCNRRAELKLLKPEALTLSMVLPPATFCDDDPGIQDPFAVSLLQKPNRATDALHAVLGLLDGRGNDSGTCMPAKVAWQRFRQQGPKSPRRSVKGIKIRQINMRHGD